MRKPKPFQRPSVDLGGHGPKKVWQRILARDVLKGDLWAEHGVVRYVRVNYHNTEIGAGENSAPYLVPSDELLLVFTKLNAGESQ